MEKCARHNTIWHNIRRARESREWIPFWTRWSSGGKRQWRRWWWRFWTLFNANVRRSKWINSTSLCTHRTAECMRGARDSEREFVYNSICTIKNIDRKRHQYQLRTQNGFSKKRVVYVVIHLALSFSLARTLVNFIALRFFLCLRFSIAQQPAHSRSVLCCTALL